MSFELGKWRRTPLAGSDGEYLWDQMAHLHVRNVPHESISGAESRLNDVKSGDFIELQSLATGVSAPDGRITLSVVFVLTGGTDGVSYIVSTFDDVCISLPIETITYLEWIPYTTKPAKIYPNGLRSSLVSGVIVPKLNLNNVVRVLDAKDNNGNNVAFTCETIFEFEGGTRVDSEGRPVGAPL